MTRIVFVCHGNICRSPMAEFVMKDLVRKEGREDDFLILSRATHSDEIWDGKGSPIYPPAAEQLLLHRITGYENKRARLLRAEDYGKYDLFIGMDEENIRFMRHIFLTDTEKKIWRLLDFAGGGSVSDPWYTRDFKKAYEDIARGCSGLYRYLSSGQS